LQKLLEGASTGKLHKVTARVQGPFGGHNLSVAEMDEPQHMIVFVGGVGAPTVLSILKRLALHREAHHIIPSGMDVSLSKYVSQMTCRSVITASATI
jgi:hypothetical protein